jgi:hypothetical protein
MPIKLNWILQNYTYITRHFQIAFVTITFLMWEKPYISIFVEIGALRNFTHFGGHLKNGFQNDRHFGITFLWKTLNINFLCNWSIGVLRNCLCVLATILKIAAKMATIMAAMAAIFKSHLSLSHSSGRKSSKYQFSLKL